MSRHFNKMTVFRLAHELVMDVYASDAQFPPEERVGVQSQLRRAAVSAACNIVEGSARLTNVEYVRFLEVALGGRRPKLPSL
jgi:four helix bundle protein